MKYLYLIRHAKSSWSNPGLADRERPLNKRGQRDAPFMAMRLRKYQVLPDRIVTSPAVRALTTARIIADGIGYPGDRLIKNEDIYTSDLNLLLKLVKDTKDVVECQFIVGHNYVITDIAEYLSGESLGNVPTCGIVGLSFGVDSWQDVGEEGGSLLFFDYPKRHKMK